MNVLVVEDGQDLRDTVEYTLSVEGFKVCAVPNVESAMEELSHNENVDVMLLDLMMPGIDGRTLLATIRADKHFKSLPIVIMTAAKILAVDGAYTVLRKPFSAASMISTLRSAIASRHLLDVDLAEYKE